MALSFVGVKSDNIAIGSAWMRSKRENVHTARMPRMATAPPNPDGISGRIPGFTPPDQGRVGVQTISSYVIPQKQATKRNYGSHQYFTKRAWNVIQHYITRFTEPGDVVCDPYGGTGVTITEALVLGRKGIYLDISRWATFLAKEVALAPVNLFGIQQAYEQIEKHCAKKINDWWKLTADEVAAIPIERWYPQNFPLPKNADVPLVEDLFTHRQLLGLSELFHWVQAIKNSEARELMRYAFSSTLYKCNRTFISAKNRIPSRGGSSIFSIYRYKVAKTTIELNPWEVFTRSVSKLIACKKETNQLIGSQAGGSNSAQFFTGYAQDLTKHVAPESVDYIFTDPPYGAHIAYLDLTRMWDAWLGFETTDQDREEETIEAGDKDHTPEHFKEKLAAGIEQMFRVLKYNRWMSLVFAHKEPAIWDAIVKAAEAAGFEYVNTVAQPLNVVWSMHKKKNPLAVLSGELIINFKKVRNPRSLAITAIGVDAVSLIKDSAELSIVQRNGQATTDEIYNDLIPKLLENGLLGKVSQEHGDITPIIESEFQYDVDNFVWRVRPGRKLGCHIPLDQRVRFYITDYLNQCVRNNERATLDKIVLNVLPKLKNGIQPTKQHILSEIRKVAAPDQGKYWILHQDSQHVFAFADETLPGTAPAIATPARKSESEYGHNEILYMLAKLGSAAGFTCHIGKKEQAGSWGEQSLSDLSIKALPFLRGAEKFVKEKVQQIDLIWLDAKRTAFAFEIEHSTSMTSGIDRFIELLKVDNTVAERAIIVLPKSRTRKLNSILSHSHYIGAPMYMEAKIRYLYYSEVEDLVTKFSLQQPSRGDVAKALTMLLHRPKSTHIAD